MSQAASATTSTTKRSPITPPAPSKFSDEIHQALFKQNLPREHGFEPLRVEGIMPSELKGTLFRAGPGLFELFGKPYTHLFEGDGAISAIKLDGGKAFGATRIIESEGLKRERRKGRMLYGFNASLPRRLRNAFRQEFKNTGNTNVIAYQGRVFALMEGAIPTEMSPNDLSTVGETTFNGTIPGMFSAHPHFVASRDTLYNFGLRMGRKTKIDLYALPTKGTPTRIGSVPLERPVMLHDFVCTDNHMVFFVSPVHMQVFNMLLQRGTFGDMFQWNGSAGTEVIVVPIDRPGDVVRFKTDAFFQWHFSNAFERDGELVVDYARYPNFDSFSALETSAIPSGQFYRSVIDPKRKTMTSEPLSGVGCEFPRVHPGFEGGDYRYSWIMSTQPHGIARIDVTTGEDIGYLFPDHQYSSEPVFVATGDAELDGYVLSLVYDHNEQASFLAVFEATKLEAGPVGKAWFDHRIPITFHGNWMDQS